MSLLLQEFEPKEWGGLTTRNHLGYAYLIKPQEAFPDIKTDLKGA